MIKIVKGSLRVGEDISSLSLTKASHPKFAKNTYESVGVGWGQTAQ